MAISITQRGNFRIDEFLRKMTGGFKQDLARKISHHSLLFFRVQYQKQGTNKDGFVKWKQRRDNDNRKVLVLTGKMRDSMKLTHQSFGKIRIEVSADYAQYHQNGTQHLPKREMLYQSKTLESQVEKIIKDELKKIFR